MIFQDEDIFVHGDIKCSDGITREEAIEIIEEIQEIMIFHKIIKLDLCIDPYKFPKDLLNITNQ
jgi:hypothetical protein